MHKFLEISKMNFNGQPNMFFSKIISCTCDLHPNMFFGNNISYTCDLHLKLDILNLLNIFLLSNGLKNESFSLQPFPSKFKL